MPADLISRAAEAYRAALAARNPGTHAPESRHSSWSVPPFIPPLRCEGSGKAPRSTAWIGRMRQGAVT